MSELNSFQLQGVVVQDAILESTANGKSICKFSMAHNYSLKKPNGEWVNEADFFNFAIFNDYAEKISPRLKKGQRLIVEGTLKQDRWEKDGQKFSKPSFAVKQIHIIYDKKNIGVEIEDQVNNSFDIDDSEIPFGEPVETVIY